MPVHLFNIMFGEAAVLGVLSTVVVPVTVPEDVTVEDTVVLVSTANAREGINRIIIRGKIFHDFMPYPHLRGFLVGFLRGLRLGGLPRLLPYVPIPLGIIHFPPSL